MIGVAHGILTPVEISVHVTPTTASRRSSVDRLLPKVCFCRFRRDTSVARALWPCGAVEGLGWWCGSGIGGKSPRVELQGAGGPQIHLDMEIAHWGLVAPGHGRKHSARLDPLQAKSISPTSASTRSDQKVAGSICSGCRQGLD